MGETRVKWWYESFKVFNLGVAGSRDTFFNDVGVLFANIYICNPAFGRMSE